MVRLPLKSDPSILGNQSRDKAMKSLIRYEKSSEPNLK